ncbi:uncharacterized protein [Drosophila tropicalis]|uniref:uncharacterized protein n=1 Tax=Drosophila tropicalis TaxID=46794 RepID=UPI0035ABDB62
MKLFLTTLTVGVWTSRGPQVKEMCVNGSSSRKKARFPANSPVKNYFSPVVMVVVVLLVLTFLLPPSFSYGNDLKAGLELPQVEQPSSAFPSSTSSSSSSLDQLIEAKLNESMSLSTGSQAKELLSRKRRYLVFPEGSSFQMVYDEIVGVVDHTNYLILGITVALAWELPSKPPSEELDDLLTKLEDGTIDISRNDTISNITYVDETTTVKATTPNYINLNGKKPISNSYYSSSPILFRTPMHPAYSYKDSYYSRPIGGRRKDNHFYYHSSPSYSPRNPFMKWSKPQPFNQNAGSRYPYWALPSKWTSNQRLGQRRQDTSTSRPTTSKPKRKPPQAARHHRIYPVFGKRSIPDANNPHQRHRRSGVTMSKHDHKDDDISKLERLQIKHHRNTRQALYERIEKYLDKRGSHGQHCVLRALCETGQKSHEQEPGSFAGELMRAIFTLPEALENEPVAYRDTHYDKAHAHTGDCAKLYPECKQSMWEAQFIQ